MSDGLWKEVKDPRTGESSIRTHELKVVAVWCAKDQHDYRLTDGRKHLATCTKCKHELPFVIGRDKLEGDKIIIG